MKQLDIKHKAISGFAWTALRNYSSMFIAFISSIILARLLTPHDYGCIGLLIVFTSLAAPFIDSGFGEALIQKKKPTNTDYSTIFFWNMGVAIVLYTVLFFSAPAIARFYDLPILSPVLRVQAIVLIINAFKIVQVNQLKKRLDFRVLSIVTMTTAVFALIVTIIMAYHGMGVWSLVTQNLLVAGIPAVVFWFYLKWRPIRVFSWKSFRELFSFGAYMLLTHFANELGKQIQTLFIGKIFNTSTLGYYSKAFSTERMASQVISGVVTSVAYPLYAEAQDDKKALANIIRRITMSISYLTFPLMLLLILIAQPVFLFLYSERWLPSVIYFQVLCLVGISSCLLSVNQQCIAAIGKSRTMFMWTLFKHGIGLTVMIAGMLIWGMTGFLVGVVAYNYFCYFVNISLVSKHIGYKWWNQLKDLLHVTLMSLTAFAAGYASTYFLHAHIYVIGAIRLLVFLSVYLGWSAILKPEACIYTVSNIPKKFRFWDKKNTI